MQGKSPHSAVIMVFSQRGPFFRDEKATHIRSFKRQELHLALDTTGVAGQAAARTDDAVARHDDENGVMPHRTAHGLCGQMCSSLLRGKGRSDLTVGRGLAIGNAQEPVPHSFLKFRALRMERRQKVRRFSAK